MSEAPGLRDVRGAGRLRELLRWPAAHFILFGLVVYAAQSSVGRRAAPSDRTSVQHGGASETSAPDSETSAPDTVVDVTPAVLGEIEHQLRESLGREPSADELGRAVERWIETEVLVREARARNLGRHDPIVRDRLAAQMAFLLDARQVTEPPDDDTLRAYYEANQQRFAYNTQVTLRQLFVSGRGDEERARAEEIVAQLRDGADPRALATRTDSPPGGPVLRSRTPARLAELFGDDFAAGLENVALDRWHLRPSGAGWHAVRVESRREGGVRPFGEVRDRVATSWHADRSRRTRQTAFEELRSKYEVRGWPR